MNQRACCAIQESHLTRGNVIAPPSAAWTVTETLTMHKDINPPRVENTCKWFLDDPIFPKWKNSSHDDLLWLSAGPGQGKSVLSRALIDDRLVEDGSATICYFFFKENEEQDNLATAICALLHQLFYDQNSLFQKHAELQVRQHKDKLKLDSSALWDLWISAASDSTKDVICIIDALDECRQPDRNQLLEKLERFYLTSSEGKRVGAKNSKLKFIVTSRPYGDIEWGFAKIINRDPKIQLAAESKVHIISQEINVVMEAKVDEIVDKRHLDDEIRTALKDRFSEIPNSTYLWLHITLDSLKSRLGSTKRKLLQQINELPRSVEQAYEDILRRCDEENEADGRRLLEIIVAARRPLKLSEIDIALEIQPNHTSFDELDLEGLDKRREWIRHACGLFVSVIDSRVYLIHQTARDFLLRQAGESENLSIWRHSIRLEEAHLALSKICITYLLFKDFQNVDHRSSPALQACLPNEAFLHYSATHWIDHTEQTLQTMNMREDWISKMAQLCDTQNRLFWLRYHINITNRSHHLLENQSAFYCACILGLVPVATFLLDRSRDFLVVIPKKLVIEVALNPSKDVLQLLLDRRGEDIQITEEVVKAAASNPFSNKVLELLLDRRGEDIQITETVIISAIRNFRTPMLQLLLDRRGEDIQITEEIVNTAAFNRSKDALQLLLDRRGEDIQITEEIVNTATSNPSSAVLQLLLDRRGEDIQITEDIVNIATSNPSSAVLQLLLDRRGEDIQITEDIVNIATSNPSSAVLQLLLDRRGEDIQITEDIVNIATSNPSSAVLQLLLDRQGEDIQITEEVVNIAASNPFSNKVLELLLDQRGEDIQITETVLISAIRNFKTDTLQLLLDRRGEDIQITNEVCKATMFDLSKDALQLLLDLRGYLNHRVRRNRLRIIKKSEIYDESVTDLLRAISYRVVLKKLFKEV
ncbi:ankyrin [Penicillium macrosclerotiorum]|uniref:ankyrin n=1 Tax=Penicillium macrosclerotiorum TaxID=303699 RepID=UPI002547F515|nr:ankyrin [Penicillium macrosclerotiorum]KAJ5683416.1 ankyrin [Penicillium macrosclerotiorum]